MGQGHPSLEFRTGVCQYLQDTYAFGQESVLGDSYTFSTLHHMIGNASRVVFFINVRYSPLSFRTCVSLLVVRLS